MPTWTLPATCLSCNGRGSGGGRRIARTARRAGRS
jgi:hypothetical protein